MIAKASSRYKICPFWSLGASAISACNSCSAKLGQYLPIKALNMVGSTVEVGGLVELVAEIYDVQLVVEHLLGKKL